MNILFLLKNFSTGGLEVVSRTLANEFVKNGHNVSFFILHVEDARILSGLSGNINVYEREKYSLSYGSIESLRRVLIKDSIQIIINQWGLPFIPVTVAKIASFRLKICIISVHHNSPDANGKLLKIKNELSETDSTIRKYVLRVIYSLVLMLMSASMRYVYNRSDCYMVLSSSFVDKFKSFTGIMNPKKLNVQTNPLTIEASGYSYLSAIKEKEVIYIGRLDSNQKKVQRLVEVWSLVEKKHSDWRLTIVGDGPDKGMLEQSVRVNNLKNVHFEGYQSPRPYYERASVLMLTSDFEGFPLVLPECMSFGVVPVVYGSYSAVYDIIKDGENGRIVKQVNNTFDKEAMADVLDEIIRNDDKRQEMALSAIETSRQYSINSIYNSWNKIFEKLVED
ncbi:MAG: glycosyltransferase [Bacteroidetes bacterium]|uniref:Glycosyltransferase n=1 Tax=Candidatus Cryptobacteroides avicola TaxID=2840757 RepID=A0A940IIS4_9BACT|nr:glycosyltransferase [Candidatus Cryptobacteroides avicola]